MQGDASVEASLHELLGSSRSSSVNWGAVVERLRTKPMEAAAYKEGQSSPLQVALTRQPRPTPGTIRAFLSAHRGAVKVPNGYGDTALHYACCYADNSLEVVKILLTEYPEATRMRGEFKRIPLHYPLNEEVARALVEVYPGGIAEKDSHGCLPLHHAVLYPKYSPAVVRFLVREGIEQKVGGPNGLGGVKVRDLRGKTPFQTLCGKIERSLSDDGSWRQSSTCSSSWDKLRFIAKVFHSASTPKDSNESFCLLTALISLRCSHNIIRRALRLNPFQTRMALHLASQNKYGFEEVLEPLLKADPKMLERRDPKSGLYPFMLAATGDDANLDSTFMLLKANPSLTQGMYTGSHWADSKLELQRGVREHAARLDQMEEAIEKLLAENAREKMEQTLKVERLQCEINELRVENAEQKQDVVKLREEVDCLKAALERNGS